MALEEVNYGDTKAYPPAMPRNGITLLPTPLQAGKDAKAQGTM